MPVAAALQVKTSALQREVSAQCRGISALHCRHLLCMANMHCNSKYLLCKGKNLFWRRNKFLVVLGLINPEKRDMSPLAVLVGGFAITRST